MDGDLLSPKRKRTGRSSSLKKSNANYIAKSSSQCGGNGGAALPRAEILIGGDDSPSANGYSMQEDSPRQGDSPSKARRYSGPTNGLNRSINEIRRNINASSKSGVKKKDANVTLSGRREEEPTSSGAAVSTESSPPRSPISLTHSQINTTVDSSSMGKKCDDTLFSFLHSPESPPSSSFLREAANERKASNGIEERERWNSQRGVSENSRQQSKHGKGEIRLISISDYSPSIPCRKGNYGIPTAASSSANAALGSVIKRPSFSCPGSENLRHTQPVEDEWRSSFEGEDGESDEEEKSSNISAAVMDNMRLRLSARPAFGQINSRSNFLLNDDDHRQMDSNMSSMALHVGKDILKGRMKSRTIFDCEPLSSEDCRPHFFLRGNKAGSRSRENLISDDSTSFVDALTQGNDDVDINFGSRRQSFTTDIRNPFLCDEDGDTGRADTSSFEEAESSGIEGWKSPPSRGRRERGGFNLFSSSFSPENNLLTPARSAGADAASMGDLGTPVTEVGSPADIDMGASYEPYVEGEEENGIFGYSTSNHSRHESDFLPCRINDCAMGPETSTPSRFRRTDYNDQRQLVLSQAALSSADNIVTGVRQHEAAESKECPYDSSDERAANIVQNDGVYSVRSSSTDKDASTFEGALRYGSSYNSPADGITRNFIGASPRFRPDQSAFDRGKNSSVGLGLGPGGKDCPSTPMRPPSNCPATPLRTPSWATDRTATYISDEERDRLGDRDREGDHHAALTRQNSLTVNKVLLSLSTTLDSADVSFHRDFEQEGFLGSGTFADVYRAREKDGKSYAVKKSKRQFRSKKDRNLLMVEVMIMKRLGEAPCPYIVQLVRAWQEDGYFFVQIDLAERGTLKDLLTDLAAKRSRPEDATVWHILHDVASGLQHIHNCGVVHLDVKPANLLISIEGIIKIGDFGTAAELGKGEDGHEGDTRYMAPELLASSDRYPSADIFSLGLTLYETCISCTPQHREAVAAGSSPLPLEGPLWHILRDGEAPPPQDRAVALCTLIHACLHPITSERPSTESILALPELINITSMTGTDLLLESAPKMPAKVPLARATSFLESMNSIKRCSSLQLSEAGRDGLAQCPIDTLDDDRALTPTGPSNGSGTTTFWQPLPVRKWFVEKDKELGGLNLPSLESIIEPQSPVATPSSSIKAVRGGLDCTASTECSSPNTSKCNSSSSGTFLFSDRQLSYDTKNSSPTDNFVYANEGRSTRSQRPIEASLSFPLPGSASSSRRRDKSYNGGVEPARARSSSSLSSPTAADLVSANLICRSPFAPVTTGSSSSTTPSVMKYRYVDSDTSSSFAVPSSKSSISVGNVFCSVGLGGYCPGANYSGKQTESNFRTVSKSIRRAGLETVSSGGERKHDKTG